MRKKHIFQRLETSNSRGHEDLRLEVVLILFCSFALWGCKECLTFSDHALQVVCMKAFAAAESGTSLLKVTHLPSKQ